MFYNTLLILLFVVISRSPPPACGLGIRYSGQWLNCYGVFFLSAGLTD